MLKRFDEQLVNAILAKFAPDICEALRTAEGYNLSNPNIPDIRIPLRADTSIIYKKELGAFTVEGRYLSADKEKWFQVRKLFTTRELLSGGDRYAVIEYLFDNMKQEFLREFVGSDLEKALKGKQPHEN